MPMTIVNNPVDLMLSWKVLIFFLLSEEFDVILHALMLDKTSEDVCLYFFSSTYKCVSVVWPGVSISCGNVFDTAIAEDDVLPDSTIGVENDCSNRFDSIFCLMNS
jgi:hypothetical protein